MTAENCLTLLEAYRKQMTDPRGENGAPLHGDQRKHVVSQSKANYEAMKKRILSSPKFVGGTVQLVDKTIKTFDRHPIVDTLLEKPKAAKKMETKE